MTQNLIANRFVINDLEKDLLGRGGMGEVYRAADTQTGETVAVKVLNPEILVYDPSLLDRFIREGEALRKLNHPNIVHMVSAVEEQGQHYLVMEFVEGGSLRDLLTTTGCLPSNDVAKIALEVADALTRAHHLGIIHRDLKPANVLLAEDGTPRLADFGIAHIQDGSHLTQSGVLIGTVDYLSPEICQGASPSELSDIWAFGVMLFEMLSGKLPFKGKSLTAKITAIVNQPLPDLSQLAPKTPDTLVDLVYRMLEKDPQQRIPSVRLVGTELEGILKERKRTDSGATAALPSSAFEADRARKSVFVGREQELIQLIKALGKTLAGHGQVAFITGDPGQGKTALLQEFGRRAQKTQAGLVVANGNCNAYTGIGDPYLPFREIMGLLSGDVETLKQAGVIGQTQATRLWNTFPYVIQQLIESGNNLVDIFVPGADLLQRAGSIPVWPDREKWLPQLEQLVRRKAAQSVDASLQQAALFEQFTRLARSLGQHAPLILLVDDLQWADSGSINLLLHLGKRLEGSRVMVIGAYRPTEVALGRGGERHPLESVVNDFKRQYGEIQVDLSQAEGRVFVNALLDTEPNRLDETFRQEFFRISCGHPLTTIELLRDMQEGGGLVKDADGYWITGPALNWDSLPVRVEATIAERMERLDKQEKKILRVAGVQGETFSAEVVAHVLGIPGPEVISCLSSILDREHHLVSAQGIRQINEQRMSFYKFRHILFQKYLYNSLDPVECALLHEQVGTTLLGLYGNEAAEISVQLAIHFQKAGTNLKAADFLNKAGDRASEMIAHQEAIEQYQLAKTSYEQALGNEWDPLQRAVLERKIGESLFKKGNHQEALTHLRQALACLRESIPERRWAVRLHIAYEILIQLVHRFLHLRFFGLGVRSSVPVAQEIIRSYETLGWIEARTNYESFFWVTLRALNIADRYGISDGIMKASTGLGIAMDFIGAHWLAEGFHKTAVEMAESTQQPATSGLAYSGMTEHRLCMGQARAAQEYVQKGIESSSKFGYSHQTGYLLDVLSVILMYQGELQRSLKNTSYNLRMGQEAADLQIQCNILCTQGGIQWRLGQIDEAANALRQAIQWSEIIPDHATHAAACGDLGRCYLRQGRLGDALEVLEKGVQICQQHGVGLGVRIPPYNGLAEACLQAADQEGQVGRTERLQAASRAGAMALRQANLYRLGLPEALRLQGTCEWLKGNGKAAQKRWEQSLKLAREQGQRYEEGLTILEMGLRLGNRDYLERSVLILSGIGAEWDLTRVRKALEKIVNSA
jgi:tetratricopeptide (TPR) repeat protein